MRHSSNPFFAFLNLIRSLRYRYSAITCLVGSLALIFLSIANIDLFNSFQNKAYDYAFTSLQKVSSQSEILHRLNYGAYLHFNAIGENKALKKENSNLRQKIEKLSIQLNDLKKLTQSLSYQEGASFASVTTKVIGASVNRSTSNLYLNSGQKNSVATGNVVANDDGVIGIVTNIFENYAIARTISDPNSRVPAISIDSRIHCIIRGDSENPNKLKIYTLADNPTFQDGEIIVTAGDGNLYPGGLVIGYVSIENGATYLVTAVNWGSLEFVRILTNNRSPSTK